MVNFFFQARNSVTVRQTCAFYSQLGDGGTGTGTLVEHRGEFFLLTCYHVAEAILNEHCYACFRLEAPRALGFLNLGMSHMKLAHGDEDEDVALIAVKKRSIARALPHLTPLTLKDIEPVDFERLPVQDYEVVGFPKAMLDNKHKDVATAGAIIYRTILSKKCPPTPTRLFLDYPERGKQHVLPEPHGMSGALIWTLPAPHLTKKGELWKPGKPIAIQTAFRRRERCLVCSPLTLLRKWLK